MAEKDKKTPAQLEAEVKEKEIAAQDYVDINNPDHGNKTYEELQAEL
jgi:hypothetical protein